MAHVCNCVGERGAGCLRCGAQGSMGEREREFFIASCLKIP